MGSPTPPPADVADGRARRRLAPAVLLVLAVVLGLTGCSSDKKAEPRRPLDTTPAPGAVVVADDAEGYAVSIPSSWVKLPTEISNFDAAADKVKAEATPAALPAVTLGLVQLKSAVRNGAVMAAIDPTTGSTANLVTLTANGQNASEVAVGAANRLIGNGATDLTKATVTVDGIEAARTRFKNAFQTDAGPVNLSESQLYVVRRDHAFILTLTGESGDLDGIANSMKFA